MIAAVHEALSGESKGKDAPVSMEHGAALHLLEMLGRWST
jgi:hypothetical protein